MTIVKGWKPLTIVLKSYILDMTRFLSLSLGYVTMLQCQIFLKIFEIMQQVLMRKYQLF